MSTRISSASIEHCTAPKSFTTVVYEPFSTISSSEEGTSNAQFAYFSTEPAHIPAVGQPIHSQPERTNQGIVAALLLACLIAALDLLWPQINFSILYAVPMMLAGREGPLRLLPRVAAVLIALTFGAYLLKASLWPGASSAPVGLDVLNRTLVAVTVLSMSFLIRRWVEFRASLRAMTEVERLSEQDVALTLSVLCGVVLMALLGLADLLAPAGCNVAVLYPIPLLILVWTKSPRSMWLTSLVAIAVASLGVFQDAKAGSPALKDLGLVALSMILITVMASGWARAE